MPGVRRIHCDESVKCFRFFFFLVVFGCPKNLNISGTMEPWKLLSISLWWHWTPNSEHISQSKTYRNFPHNTSAIRQIFGLAFLFTFLSICLSNSNPVFPFCSSKPFCRLIPVIYSRLMFSSNGTDVKNDVITCSVGRFRIHFMHCICAPQPIHAHSLTLFIQQTHVLANTHQFIM